MEDSNIKKVENLVKNTEYPTEGTFITRLQFVRVTRVLKNEESLIDKNGEEHFGVMGDLRLIDSSGNEFYLDRRSFKEIYAPFDKDSFEMVKEDGYKTLLRLNSTIHDLGFEND